VSVGGKRVGAFDLPRPPRQLTQRRTTVAGHALLQIGVVDLSGQRAEMLLTAPPELRLIFSGRTGPGGVDGEWSRVLRVTAEGVLLYQRRDGVTRCDGEPVYLFPRMYDFASSRFRPVSAVPRVAQVESLVASRTIRDRPTGTPLNTFRLVAASTHQGDEGQAANLAPPVEAEDGKLDTAWFESLGGAGLGELLTARAQPSPYRLKALSIIPGDAASPAAFARANRLKSVLLLLSPTQRYRLTFPQDPLRTAGKPSDPFWVILPRPVATTCASIVIEAVYPGTAPNGGRTAVSELHFFTELEFGDGLAQLGRDLESDDDQRGEAAVQVLARLGPRALPLVEQAIARGAGEPRSRVERSAQHETDVLTRAMHVLVKLQLPATAAPLARLLPRLTPPAAAEALDALVALGSDSVGELVQQLLVPGVPSALGRIGGDAAREALLQRAGSGSKAVRKAVADALSLLRRPADLEAILDAAQAATDRRRRADLVLVAGRIGAQLGQPEVTATRIAAMWPAEDAFELRYRIIGGVGRLAPERHLPLLRRVLQDKDPVLRWIAAEQVRRVPNQTATLLLQRLVDDPDPRVRAVAALALGHRAVQRASGVVLARRLKREPWTMVARVLAESLGHQCLAEGLAVLRQRLVSGPRGVDLRALISIASCAPPGLDRELLALAESRTWRVPLRQRALELLTPTMITQRATDLLRLYRELRRRAPRSEDEEALAVSAGNVLARSRTGDAALALADALALDPHESIRVAAAVALGKICHRDTRQTLMRAIKDASRPVREAAKRAVKRCRF